jgi:hypothetical protein
MSLIHTFTPESNFWEEHQEMRVAGPFKLLYNSDRSTNKMHSSKMAWCIVIIWDTASKYYRMPEDGPDNKIDLIFNEYYDKPGYYGLNKKKVDELKAFYIRMQDTPARRTLREIEMKLEERTRFMAGEQYTLGICNERGSWVGNTATILDKMLADTKKIYDLYEQAKADVEKENAKDGKVKGGGNLSLSDQEII